MSSPSRRWMLMTILLLASLPGSAVTFEETFVEPFFMDCADQTIRPSHFGRGDGTSNDMDLDADGVFEGTGDEDGGSDPISRTIQDAVAMTDPGGIVNILGDGVYREKIQIDHSLTIRAHGDAVLEGSCLDVNGIAIEVTAEDAIVRIEGLTIRGYDTGIASEDSTLIVRNCRIVACGTGIVPPDAANTRFTMMGTLVGDCTVAGLDGDAGDWEVADSTIEGCTRGIHINTVGDGSLAVSDSRILRSTNDGIRMESSTGDVVLTVHGCQIGSNGSRGIHLAGRQDSALRVTGSLVEGNGSDGIFMENDGGCLPGLTHQARGFVADSRVIGNAGDGFEIKGSGVGCNPLMGNGFSTVRAGVVHSSFAMNGGYGIMASTGGTFVCGVGQNQLSFNSSGAEGGGPQCTVSTTNNNQGS